MAAGYRRVPLGEGDEMQQQQSTPGHLAVYLMLEPILWLAGDIHNVCVWHLY